MSWKTLDGAAPVVIAHRGASGYRPEHTLESYALAIEMGADYIEPDLVSTRDGVLVARHEPNIAQTTDVAAHPEFAARRTTKLIDGVAQEGWFTTDFTLAELHTLRAVQPREYRSKEFDGHFLVPTLGQIIQLAQRESVARRRRIGIYPETKHPSWHCAQGLALEPPLLAALADAGWTSAEAPVFLQSFERGNLQWLRERTGVPLVQLIDGDGLDTAGRAKPARQWARNETGSLYPALQPPADFASPASLHLIASYCDAIGPWKRFIVGEDALPGPEDLIRHAHAAGLRVHPWTFRNEPMHLAAPYREDPRAEYRQFYALGVDGLFSDFSDTAVGARESMRVSPPAPGRPAT
jgi:glycerophosphoryl diester phosphodiesterase